MMGPLPYAPTSNLYEYAPSFKRPRTWHESDGGVEEEQEEAYIETRCVWQRRRRRRGGGDCWLTIGVAATVYSRLLVPVVVLSCVATSLDEAEEDGPALPLPTIKGAGTGTRSYSYDPSPPGTRAAAACAVNVGTKGGYD